MGSFKRDRSLDMTYKHCIYKGISEAIEFEMKYGWTDMRKELTYAVERYCEEELLSGAHLMERLEAYCAIAERKYGKLPGM